MSLLDERPFDISFEMPEAKEVEHEAFSAPFQSPEAELAYQSGIADMAAPAPDERFDDASKIAMERIRVARELTTLMGFETDVHTVSTAADGLEVIGIPTDDFYDREVTSLLLKHYIESRRRQAAIDGTRHNLGELAVEIFGDDIPAFLAGEKPKQEAA